ncbi:MAG: class I SAM-dependent methyltransferase [Defluviitaleaceae bacterium]|nr:class I SAM-dependent methyltransferase [Defluviitaleaceae bacterium]MCL2240024.1 class I SAM-dependent methyltransferase [Defluviitaleaceae bacterium]MCL2240683.1 class I SAM-dependent methyltransferase [Defluviitaleaceae bacterium]
MNPIENHYTHNYDEQARFDHRYNLVEYRTTLHYIEKYLAQKPNAYVLEVGAGTGRYSRAIADKGYRVEAVELVPHNIAIFESLTTPGQDIRVTQGNALDLSAFADNTFDLTLVLGPLYHFYHDADKERCIAEAVRVTRPGGVVFAAYVISDITLYEYGFRTGQLDIPDYIEKGKIHPHTFATTSVPADIFEMVRKEDIDRLMGRFPNTARLHYVATTLVARLLRDCLDAMDEDAFGLYMRYHLAVCERPDMMGMTSHSLDIFRIGA